MDSCSEEEEEFDDDVIGGVVVSRADLWEEEFGGIGEIVVAAELFEEEEWGRFCDEDFELGGGGGVGFGDGVAACLVGGVFVVEWRPGVVFR